MDGTESCVNSGGVWPEGQAPPDGPPITKFTVKFEKPGTYSYVCNCSPVDDRRDNSQVAN